MPLRRMTRRLPLPRLPLPRLVPGTDRVWARKSALGLRVTPKNDWTRIWQGGEGKEPADAQRLEVLRGYARARAREVLKRCARGKLRKNDEKTWVLAQRFQVLRNASKRCASVCTTRECNVCKCCAQHFQKGSATLRMPFETHAGGGTHAYTPAYRCSCGVAL